MTVTKCKVRLYERPHSQRGFKVYIASQNGLPVAECIAATKGEAKEALRQELVEKFAPGRGVGLDSDYFRVVWC